MLRTMRWIGRPKEGYLVFWQLMGLIAFGWAMYRGYELRWWLLALFGYFCMFGLGITVTFHRLMAHRSYRLVKPLEYLFALFANLGCTGSSVGWIFVHRMHHRYSDKEGDPHSPIVLGKLGAIIGQYGNGFDKWCVRDLVRDPVHRFYHDYYNIIITLVPALLVCIGVEYFIFGFAIPVFFNTAASRLSNWIDHEPKFGVRPHASGDMAHNVWWWSLLTFGEGWHNNHHAFPGDFRFGRKWYEVDIGQYIIRFLAMMGAVRLKRVGS